MSEQEIKSKLSDFLQRHPHFDEECHVVYFLVEARKVLDRRGKLAGFSTLRFYADWCVHIEKDRRLDVVEPIAERMYAAASAYLSNRNPQTEKGLGAVAEFVAMKALRDEVVRLLVSLTINPHTLCDRQPWQSFVALLSSVLGDQPINAPSPNVAQVRFISGANCCEIVFRKQVAGHRSFPYHLV